MEQLITDLKHHIVETLGLEDVAPDSIDPDASLFRTGLGLDSIDALELVVMVEKHYGIKLKQMAAARAAFQSVRTLATFIADHRPPGS